MRPARAVAPLAALLLLAPPAAAQIPDTFQNLQILPKDISRDSLIGIMRGFSLHLGVRCSHCHVGGENPNTLRGVQFHKDDDPDKGTARFMMRMLDSLNRTVLAALPDRGPHPVTMQCKTCHRGQARPLLLTQELAIALDSGGVGAAVTRYRTLRQQDMLTGAFDFREWEMNTFAQELAERGRTAEAIGIFELNGEFHPESAAIPMSLGQLYETTGDTARAIAAYQKSLSLQRNPAAERALERLRRP